MPGHRSIYIRSVAERAGALEEYPSDRTVLVSSCIQGEEETIESPSQGPADGALPTDMEAGLVPIVLQFAATDLAGKGQVQPILLAEHVLKRFK